MLLLVLGDLWRVQTFHLPDYGPFVDSHLAASDIVALYPGHDLTSHHLPYLQTDIEYPVLTGFTMWLTAWAPGIEGYFFANALLLLACAIGTMLLLAQLSPVNRLWRFALAPMLWSYSSLNWDLLSLLELTAAIFFLRRHRFGWAGIMLALGTWTKLYPGFLLPVALAYSLRVEGPRGARARNDPAEAGGTGVPSPVGGTSVGAAPSGRPPRHPLRPFADAHTRRTGAERQSLPLTVGGASRTGLTGGESVAARLRGLMSWDAPLVRLLVGFLAVTLVLNLPLALLNFHGWSYFLRMQSGRDINPDSIWAHVPGAQVRLINLWFPELFLFGLLWLGLRVWWGDRWEPAALLSILLFLLFTKDYSPQYDLWILPLLALLACPLWLWLLFMVADFLYYAAIFFWLYHTFGFSFAVSLSTPDNILGLTVWGREIALGLLFVWGVRRLIARDDNEAWLLEPRRPGAQ